MTCPHSTENGGGVEYSGIKIHCYFRDMPMENYCPSSVLHAVQLDEYQIVSTLQADMKVFTLNKEARRGYKFPALAQNLVSFPVLS